MQFFVNFTVTYLIFYLETQFLMHFTCLDPVSTVLSKTCCPNLFQIQAAHRQPSKPFSMQRKFFLPMVPFSPPSRRKHKKHIQKSIKIKAREENFSRFSTVFLLLI